MNLYEQQLAIEHEMHGAGILRFEKNNQRSIDAGSASEADWFRRLTREFVKPMADAIEAYKDYYKGRRGKPSATLAHLKCISSEATAYITMKTVFDSLGMEFVSSQSLAKKIGSHIEDEIRFSELTSTAPEYIQAIKASLKKRANQSYKFERDTLVHAEKELKLLSDYQKLKEGNTTDLRIQELLGIDTDKLVHLEAKSQYVIDVDRWVPWSINDTLQLGAKLLDIFANNILLDGRPLIEAKNTRSSNLSVNTVSTIRATDALEKWVSEYKEVMSSLSPAFEPCVVPPRPWVNASDGGYHTKKVASRLPLVKVKDRKHLKKFYGSDKMPKVYQAVNKLQRVEWEVNKDVLAVADKIRALGLPLGLPSMDKEEKPVCPVPAIYSELRGKELMQCLDEDQQEEFKEWKQATVSYYASEQKRRADVREAIATIDQANRFKEFERIYFVYTLDFRSRVYSRSNLISPQGGDLQKALVRFHKAEKLGKTGAYWLKVHGANLWEWDKDEMDDRVSQCETEEFTEMCRDIAADPLTFKEWLNADKPWQFLAWCFEYSEYLDWIDNGHNEADFKSKTAVAMDGSCSGIQHYSAMLRDPIGGAAVNLVPSDRPQDIYRSVAELVTEWMEAIIDSKEGDFPYWTDIQDKFGAVKGYKMAEEWLRIQINRNLTKKPVMTLPYGSSQLTCRQTVSDYLVDMQQKMDNKARLSGHKLGKFHQFTKAGGDLPLEEGKSFATSFIWKAIGHVVVAARAAMKFIKKVTHQVAEENKPLVYETPLGFTVYQALYEQSDDRQVFTSMMGGCKFKVKEDTNVIDVARMKSACAPNFVHSMDASHLMLAVCYFDNAGIESIAVIHDSFGTHAGKTELLRDNLSGSFVDMYQEHDVLQEFVDYIEKDMMIVVEAEMPAKGELDLEVVRDSIYCFA